jgi:hypothetical protein
MNCFKNATGEALNTLACKASLAHPAIMSENINDMKLAASKDIISFWIDAKAVEHEKITTKDKGVHYYKPR